MTRRFRGVLPAALTLVLLGILLVAGGVLWFLPSLPFSYLYPRNPVINGFAGLSWGADTASIRRVHGEPDRVDPRFGPGGSRKRFVYHTGGRFLGETVPMTLVVDSEKGLVKGFYRVHVRKHPADCGELLVRSHAELTSRYQGLNPWLGVRNELSTGFCYAQKLGKAGVRMIWTDPVTGARAGFTLAPRDPNLSVVFDSQPAPRTKQAAPETE